MKKQLICLTIMMGAFLAGQAQSPFTIEGQLDNLKAPSRIILQYTTDGERVTDTAAINNGKFIIKGKVDRPIKATITLQSLKDTGPMTFEKMMAADKQEFYLDMGSTKVQGNGNIKSAHIKGGGAQKDYLLLQQQLQPLQDKMQPLSNRMMQLFKEKNKEAQQELLPKLSAIRKEMNKVEDAFVYDHPDSYVSFDMVKDKAVVIDPKTFEPFFTSLSDRLRHTEEGVKLAERLTLAKKLDIGQHAIDFTQNNTQGVPVALSSLKGQYVLVDFWASWCGPCRAENPNVVKAYEKFKDKNFEIIGVSLDDKKAPWLKAIKDDGLPWIHVSDLKGWQNEVAQEYGVRAVPQNFLIDPDGIIIAKNLRGEALDKTLSELIKN